MSWQKSSKSCNVCVTRVSMAARRSSTTIRRSNSSPPVRWSWATSVSWTISSSSPGRSTLRSRMTGIRWNRFCCRMVLLAWICWRLCMALSQEIYGISIGYLARNKKNRTIDNYIFFPNKIIIMIFFKKICGKKLE